MSMTRVEALIQIIKFGPNRDTAYMELLKLGYDSNVELYEVTKSDLAAVLKMYLSDNLSNDELEEWANFIECRDDLNYEAIEGYIYALANPYLDDEITIAKAAKMLELLDA